jgi:hypothetical protein
MLKSIPFFVLLTLVLIAGQTETWTQARSSNLSAGDIKALLVKASRGCINPHEIVADLSQSDGRYVSMTRELLFEERSTVLIPVESKGDTVRSRHVPMPGYAVLVGVLETVGSSECFNCLCDAAEKHPDAQVRGFCLNSLAKSFQLRAKKGLVRPDKQLIRFFLSQASDTLMIRGPEKRVGDIARDGLIRWTTRGGFLPIPRVLQVRDADKRATGKAYWERWWSRNSSRVYLDARTGLFVLPRG